MQERYFRDNYRFIPPYRSKFWCYTLAPIFKAKIPKVFNLHRWKFQGAEHLRHSLDQNAGMLLTPNHSRQADTPAVGLLGHSVGQFVYFVASYHLFKQERWRRWLINRMGAFSIWREGTDREAIRECVKILQKAERPLVIFPEGTWFRQNERLGKLQDGVSLIARQAARKADRPIHVLPVAIKYWLLEDPTPSLERRLSRLEQSLRWQPQSDLEWLPRIEKLSRAMLGVKEVEHFGEAQRGELDDRINNLIDSHLAELEDGYFGQGREGTVIERVRALRQHIVRRLVSENAAKEEVEDARKALENLMFCELLVAHDFEYLRENPSYERVTEAVDRIEETLTDRDTTDVPLGAVLKVGPPLDLADFAAEKRRKGEADPLTDAIADSLRQMMSDLLAEGPPAEWNCPRRPVLQI